MSINLSLFGLSASLTEALLADSQVATEILIPPDRDAQMAAIGFNIPRTVDERPEETLKLHKDWHLMHAFYAGDLAPARGSGIEAGWPDTFLLQGGRTLAGENGYGPDRLLTASEVGDVDAFLSGIQFEDTLVALTEDALRASDIYVYGGENGVSLQETRETARIVHQEIVDFFRRCATGSHTCLLMLT